MTTEFKLGDIVYHKCGRMCNGKYGYIDIGPDEDESLWVLDNERAPEMPVKGNEHLIRVVGNVKDTPELLAEWSYQDNLYSIEDLRDSYKKYQDNLNTDFDQFLIEAKESIRRKFKLQAFINILSKKAQEKYPDYIVRCNPSCHADAELTIYNVPDEICNRETTKKFKDLRDECYDFISDLTKDEFDVMVSIKSVSVTKEHYSYIVERYNKENEEK